MNPTINSILVAKDNPYTGINFIDRAPEDLKWPFRCKLTRHDGTTEEVLLTGHQILTAFRERGFKPQLPAFSKRITEARGKLGLSQAAAARKWGFSQATLSAWEKGTRNPAGLYKEKLEPILEQIERGSK